MTFAVGAVTGTVLSFEFGLLWPEFTGRFGEVFGVLFAIEGIFFFLEAIFVAIYIFGWKRLRPWTHFWAGVPIPICGLGGAFSVVAVNSWMNQPQGFSPTTGDVTKVEPLKVIFNPAVPYEVPHMILAAYLVSGFLVASVYAVGMLRGRRDRYHRLGLLIPLTVACILTPIQFAVGDTAARAIAKDQPIKFAAMECVQETATHVTEYIYGRCTPDGVKGGIGIPGFDSFLVGWSTDTQGDRARHRAARGPAAGQHDAALGVRHDGRDRHDADRARAVARRSPGGASATSRRRSGSCAPSRCRASRRWSRWSAAGSSPRSAASPGSSTRSCAPRTPSPTPTASGSRSGSSSGSTRSWASALVLTLLAMARRWRAAGRGGLRGPLRARPRRPAALAEERSEHRGRRRRGAVGRRDDVRVFGGADFGAGFWSLVAGGGERGRRARELIDWAIGPVWEANHVWLIFVLVVLWTGFSAAFAAIFSTLFIPLSLAALGIVLRGSGFAFHKTARRPGAGTSPSGCSASSSLLTPFFMGTVVGAIASGRVPPGNAAGDPVRAGSTCCRC